MPLNYLHMQAESSQNPGDPGQKPSGSRKDRPSIWIKTDHTKGHDQVRDPMESRVRDQTPFVDSKKRPWTITVLGAGVVGSLITAVLLNSGCDVILVARPDRKAELDQWGLIVHHMDAEAPTRWKPEVRDTLVGSPVTDWLIVALPNQQLDGIIPDLVRTRYPNILIFGNNGGGFERFRQAMGRRVAFGYPGCAGYKKGAVIYFRFYRGWACTLLTTTLGEMGGRLTNRLIFLTSQIRQGGWYAIMHSEMESWQISHTSVMRPIVLALDRCGGSLETLSTSSNELKRVVKEIRRNFFQQLRARFIIAPVKMTAFFLPMGIITRLLSWYFSTPLGQESVGGYLIRNRAELEFVFAEYSRITRQKQKTS
ncbi:hypothetical protein DC28_07960 [Spirochaeta lutea]|uniref:Ketopantoate reductase N-terminal domain-containing protein n=2 Tax=Spirochaeta lutea TaxID=1480694 RepID=A0A098QVY9_9SPIO|nr:hypothetical protein DC28_07960 [Spirochaeta lutea]